MVRINYLDAYTAVASQALPRKRQRGFDGLRGCTPRWTQEYRLKPAGSWELAHQGAQIIHGRSALQIVQSEKVFLMAKAWACDKSGGPDRHQGGAAFQAVFHLAHIGGGGVVGLVQSLQ